ncbi:MAG TPA: ABC transporter ATP-binding protein [Acidimicrobiia bacterium]|nr:ABC transporter ATP-binding protein [Acidimicrobiia bacterium]
MTSSPEESVGAAPGWVRRLVGYMLRHRADMFVSFGAAVAGTVIASFSPIIQKVIVDDVIVAGDRPLAPWLALLVVAGVVRFALAYVRRFRGGRIALDVQHDLRTEIFSQLQRLDFARHDELQTGQLVSRASSDVALVQGFLQFLPIGMANVVLFAVSIGFMLWLSPLLTLVMLVVGPALLFTALRLRTAVFPASWDAQQRAGDVANVVEEAVTGVRVVKGFGQERQELGRLTDRSTSLFGARVRLVDLQARLQPTLQVIPAIGQVAVLALGGWLAIEGRITLGTFLAFSTYMLRLTPPVRMLAAILTVGQLARAGAERIFDLLDSNPSVEERADAIDLPDGPGIVEFDAVTFGYLRREPVLRDFSLRVESGETVALVGTSGSGKSTIGLLLPRFYDVQEGAVRVDGIDVRDVTLESLRRHLGVVFEDSFLFSDSVRANIAFARPDATDAEVEAAARAAEAHEFITELPNGYDTVVGEFGLTLSGGQRQRVALARALLSDPHILLLDDATSAVDARVEEEIHATLRRLLAGRTTLLIAHRRSSLALADRIVVVDGGTVLDQGTHDELMARCAQYRLLLAGPGDDAEGIDAPDADAVAHADDERDASGITPSAWRGVELDPLDTLRAVPLATGGPGTARPGGFGPPAGGMGAMGITLAPTPELLERVAALPPATATPGVDPAVEALPDPEFRFLQFLRPYRRGLAIGIGLVALDAIAVLLGPALVRRGIDRGVVENATGALLAAALVYLGVVLADWAVMWGQTRAMGRVSERLLHALRIKVFAQLQRLGLDYYEREMAGRVMTRMTTDIDSLAQLLQTGLVTALVNLVTFVGVGFALVVMNPRLALVSALVLPPLAVATIWFRAQSGKAYEAARERIAAVNANLQEGLSGVRVSQAYGQERRNVAEFEGVARGYLEARLGAQRLVAMYFPFVEMLAELATALVLGAGSVFVADGTLSTGELLAFVLYLDLFFAPIQQLSQVFDSYQQARVSLGRIGDLLAMETSIPEPADPVFPDRLRGEITLRDVHFAYPGTTIEALRGVDLTVAPGETVALVGETGAGKSTVLKLVARFYDTTSGEVAVDGVPVERYDPVAFHAQLGVVPQEPFLFTGTIRDNIAYGRRDATDADVEAAARAVGAHDFIATLRGGYLHPVSERGRSLSSGQRQLIALARAHLVDPVILLLDEATSNLDLGTEARVTRAMGIAAHGRTTVLIAHRLQTARLADRIVVLDAGRVVEEGTHDALVAREGHYAALWAATEGIARTA